MSDLSEKLDEGVTRKFNFTKSGVDLEIIIREPKDTDGQYALQTWPSAPILAQFIFYNLDDFKNKTILELGAGTSLPGIVAAKIGAKSVILTDKHEPKSCLELCKYNVNLNNVNYGEEKVKIQPLTWGRFNHDLVKSNWVDYIISSDCFYDKNDFEDIIVTISYIIDKHPNKLTVFYTIYQERCSHWNIDCLLKQYDLKCDYINLNDFDGYSIASTSRHSLYLLKITKINV